MNRLPRGVALDEDPLTGPQILHLVELGLRDLALDAAEEGSAALQDDRELAGRVLLDAGDVARHLDEMIAVSPVRGNRGVEIGGRQAFGGHAERRRCVAFRRGAIGRSEKEEDGQNDDGNRQKPHISPQDSGSLRRSDRQGQDHRPTVHLRRSREGFVGRAFPPRPRRKNGGRERGGGLMTCGFAHCDRLDRGVRAAR